MSAASSPPKAQSAPAANKAQPPAPVTQSPEQRFRQEAARLSAVFLREWVGEERAAEAIGRISTAIASSAAAARNPTEFYACTPQSIACCAATAALTGIMPSTGSAALAYVYPQAPRRGEPPQLVYTLSHRGLNALARRCGQTMIPVPISFRDRIADDGQGGVQILERDLDKPPLTFEEVRGVVVIVKELTTNHPTARVWMPQSQIEQRRAMSRSWNSQEYRQYSPWAVWPVEMAMKSAMHYAISRGACVIDDTSAVRSLMMDVEGDGDFRVIPSEPVRKLETTSAPLSKSAALADKLSASDEPKAASQTAASPAPTTTPSDPSPGSTGWWLSHMKTCRSKSECIVMHAEWDKDRSKFSKDDADTIEAGFATLLPTLPA